ncbi:cholesterol 24-hydroxylase-like [Patiria miniata]|uniref:Cholesterol 24-hydroxylase n=1 Tax=Patiria miniata TaxID=46514 RepID=A0A914BEQ5_PATMI|nr:cholesterol 24-hydroxylase-like [Patiria miniata]
MALCETLPTCLLMYTAAVILPVVVCIFGVCVIYLHYVHLKYAHIPSPPRDGFFLGHATTFYRNMNKGTPFAEAFLDMSIECGPVMVAFFLHLPIVQVSDTGAVKEILLSSAHFKPRFTYSVFSKVFGARFLGSGLVSQLDSAKHDKVRAMLNPVFTRKYLATFAEQFNAGAETLIEKLSQKADGKTEVAMLDEFNRTTLDVIAKVAFGMELNCTMDENTPFNKAITLALQGMSTTFQSTLATFSPLPSARKFRQDVRDSIKLLRETGRQCIEQKQRAIERHEEVPDDILTQIIKQSMQLEEKDQLQMEEIIDEFVTLFFAGQETTANLLSFCLVELGNHPEIMHRLRTEIEAVMGDKDRLEMSDVGKLTYTMQVLKETLRLWPPVTGAIRELGHDVTVRGYHLPAGTTVSMNTYCMARMEEFFENPMQFDPDRFKASDDKPLYAYFPFSMGSRNCIGQQFAMIEARILLARLLHRFHFDLVPGQGYGIKDEVTLKPSGRCRNYIRLVEES